MHKDFEDVFVTFAILTANLMIAGKMKMWVRTTSVKCQKKEAGSGTMKNHKISQVI